jgi:type IV pilus biogenesis protein PilP
MPPARPAALAQAVNTAVAAAVATQPEAKVAAAAPPAASAETPVGDEPDVTTPMPKIPTSASVAKVATEKNALATSKIALIGVFGTDGSRYAYVRLSNGTLKKVKVGDQLDGGSVVAISASDLRYQRGGKEIVLSMPREG